MASGVFDQILVTIDGSPALSIAHFGPLESGRLEKESDASPGVAPLLLGSGLLLSSSAHLQQAIPGTSAVTDWIPDGAPQKLLVDGLGLDASGAPFYDASGGYARFQAELWIDPVADIVWLQRDPFKVSWAGNVIELGHLELSETTVLSETIRLA